MDRGWGTEAFGSLDLEAEQKSPGKTFFIVLYLSLHVPIALLHLKTAILLAAMSGLVPLALNSPNSDRNNFLLLAQPSTPSF